MKIVFMGTPYFAAPSLEMLIENGYEIAGVFTQPDRQKGRGYCFVPPPVKILAQENGIAVFQFEKIKSAQGVSALRRLAPDLMVTVAFGQILSKEILDVPKRGCVNVHASLLPKYRGAAPIQWAIINGEKTTGITTMYTDEGLDTGDMILKERTTIGPEETGGELYERLAQLGAKVLKKTIALIEKGEAKREKQKEEDASYYPLLNKKMSEMDFHKTAEQLTDLARALDPIMGLYTTWKGQKIKIWKLRPYDTEHTGKPGEVIISDAKKGLVAALADGAVEIVEMQFPGGKRLPASEILKGKKMDAGTVLGGGE